MMTKPPRPGLVSKTQTSHWLLNSNAKVLGTSTKLASTLCLLTPASIHEPEAASDRITQ